MKRPFKKGEFTYEEATALLGNCCKSKYCCVRKPSWKTRLKRFFGISKTKYRIPIKEIWINACGNWVYAKTCK